MQRIPTEDKSHSLPTVASLAQHMQIIAQVTTARAQMNPATITDKRGAQIQRSLITKLQTIHRSPSDHQARSRSQIARLKSHAKLSCTMSDAAKVPPCGNFVNHGTVTNNVQLVQR